jgi:hypothetical protein
MQIVEVPGVGEVEFPDGMSDADVLAAVRKLSGPQPVASHAPAQPPPGVSGVESGGRGALQGVTFGWGDEAAAAVDAAIPGISRFVNKEVLAAAPEGATLGERYRTAREYYRARNEAARGANPGTYLAGQVVGGVAPALTGAGAAATGTRALLGAAGQGAAAGAGYSEADEALGLARDTALGGALGTAGYGAGKVLGQGLSWLGRKAGQVANLARARAGTQAAQEIGEGLQSAAGKVGGEVQKGSRYIENLMRLEESMTPQQRALYAGLQAQGVVPALQRSVAQGTLEALPGQASTIAARQAELAALQSAAPQAVSERTAALLTPQVKKDALSLAKSYAEPLLWAVGAQQAGSALGLDPGEQVALAGAAGLIGGRTRAGKALLTRLRRPAHQLAVAEATQRAAARLGPAGQILLRRAAPAAAIPLIVNQEE